MSRHLKLLVFVILVIIPFILTSQLAQRAPVHMDKIPHDLMGPASESNNAMCSLCIQLMSQTINQLINIIINVGVIGTCGKLCSYLSPYGQIAVVACDLICSYVGIEEFIKVIKKADLDVVFICQEIRICPIHDCELEPCAAFGNANIYPDTQRKSHVNEVSFATTFDVYDQTGTGELLFGVQTAPGSYPPVLEGGELVPDGFAKGSYNLQYNIKLQDKLDADPFPIVYRPGVYKIRNYVCQGLCFSDHRHARVLAVQTGANFTLTN